MARKIDIERAQQKLKVRSELLTTRVKQQELKDKQQRLKQQLKSMGGR